MMLGILAGVCAVSIAVLFRSILRWHEVNKILRRMNSSETRQFALKNIFSWQPPISQKKYEKLVPIALDAVARGLYSGAGLLQAIREAASANTDAVSADLQIVIYEVELGSTLEEALYRWRSRRVYQSVQVAVSAISLAIEVGGNQAQAIDSASDAVRRTVEATAIALTHSTDARYSMWAIVVMPFFVSGPMIVFNRNARHFMLETPYGWMALAIGFSCDALGLFWIKSLTRRALA